MAKNLKSTANIGSQVATFDQMINRFGVVTVMNAKVFKEPLVTILNPTKAEDLKVHDIINKLEAVESSKYVPLDTLKIANINMEGPEKTVTGGQYANPLLKYGKTATIEMQDALGNVDALEAFGMGFVETFAGVTGKTKTFHVTEDFAGPKTILGDSFFIDQKTGAQVPVQILLYQVLPDSIMNLTQDAEGDATVFDLNGSLLATTILVGTDGTSDETDTQKGIFYSVVPKISDAEYKDLDTNSLPA